MLDLKLVFPENFEAYSNYGNLSTLKLEVEKYLNHFVTIEKQSKLIANIIDNVTNLIMSEFCAESFWVTIRPMPANKLYEVPRWHKDGYMFSPWERAQYKVAIAFKGAGTLFCNPPEGLNSKFDLIDSNEKYFP